jgi:TrmH family RNA methyltransferase
MFSMAMMITSAKNPRIKAAADLRDRKERDATGLFLIDGIREIRRALAAGVEILELFECEEFLEKLPGLEADSFSVSPAAFERLGYGDRRHGVVAVARQFPLRLEKLTAIQAKRICVYVEVEKPGNVGALLRTADAAGIDGVILADAKTDLFNPNVVRASAGALFSMPLASATAAETLAWLRQHHFQMLAARVEGAVDYRQVDWSEPCSIILGSEAKGLDGAWNGQDIAAISLPMRGKVDSLNVSVAAGLLLYEMMRGERPSEEDRRRT